MSTPGSNLRYWRIKRGLTGEGLYKKSGITKATISEIETGKRTNIESDTWQSLAEALDLPQKELQFGNAPELPETLPPDTSDRIRRLRERVALTQAELVSILGVDRSSVYRWEKGSAVPSHAEISGLCAALEVPIEVLFGVVEEPKQRPLRIDTVLDLLNDQHAEFIRIKTEAVKLTKVQDIINALVKIDNESELDLVRDCLGIETKATNPELEGDQGSER